MKLFIVIKKKWETNNIQKKKNLSRTKINNAIQGLMMVFEYILCWIRKETFITGNKHTSYNNIILTIMYRTKKIIRIAGLGNFNSEIKFKKFKATIDSVISSIIKVKKTAVVQRWRDCFTSQNSGVRFPAVTIVLFFHYFNENLNETSSLNFWSY